jgi:uncharacterized protein YndB with AHSA1/START domain
LAGRFKKPAFFFYSIFDKSFSVARRKIAEKSMNKSWSEFRLRVNIRVPMDKVYAAWATPEGLESWFLRRAIQKDNQYEWYWHGYPDSVMEKGLITAANGTNHFAFTFSMGCPVSISLYKECEETIVELVESGLPTDEETALKHYVGDSKGWIFYLTNLKSVLEGGLDLRNRKVELTNVITS